MRARYRDPPPPEHEGRERGPPVQDAQATAARLGEFRVVLPDRGGHYESVRGAEMASVMTGVDDGAELGELVQNRGLACVAAGDGDSGGQHDPGDAGHAGPADAHEVDGAKLGDGNRVGRRYQAHVEAPSVWAARLTARLVLPPSPRGQGRRRRRGARARWTHLTWL